jgi:hypothetical protein
MALVRASLCSASLLAKYKLSGGGVLVGNLDLRDVESVETGHIPVGRNEDIDGGKEVAGASACPRARERIEIA